ncbi:MAG: FAD:protein FMN transferase [Bacilli bacterium]|nr:FAD:protein FMN transferase [Bacilli bacterium]
MRKLIEKRNYIILIIIVLLIIWIFSSKKEIFVKSFNFNNSIITYVIYDKIDDNIVRKNIEKIYKKYENKSLDEKSKKYIFDKTDGYFEDISNYLVSYSTSEVLKYFKEKGIKKYMINVDGDVILGNKYSDKDYSVSIHDPFDNSVLKIVYFSNKALSSVKSFDDFDNLKGDKKDYDMVSVICSDIITSNIVSNYIFYLSMEDGENVLLKNKCDGLWYINGRIYTSSNFSKYFNKKL